MTFILDAVDRRILALLVEDGRKPAAEMARHIPGVSERSIRYRIERLKRSGVLRVSAIINPQALGYATIGDVVIDVAPGCLQEVAAQLVALDQVSYVAGAVGDGDLNAQVYAHDTEELVRLTNEVIGVIPGVTRVRTIIVPWKLKEVCDWRVPAESGEEGAPMT
jgi:Lrp/AsnC family transcriptional regulator, regulator for asnA, asnC and gidA